MKRVLTAVILIPLVLFIILEAPFWFQIFVAGVIAEFALYEYLVLADASGSQVPRVLVMFFGALAFAVTYWAPGFLLTALGTFGLVLLGVCALRSPIHQILADTSFSFFGLMYVIYPMALAPLLLAQENGPALLIFLMVVVWAGDITALYVGRSIGRHKMAALLSPKKTWEGAAGSVVGSMLAGLAVIGLGAWMNGRGNSTLLYPQPWWYWALLSVPLNVSAQIGDLLESAIKRGAGVKDSGSLLPGHGGFLDRVDALLLALPVLWCALLLQQYTF